MAKSRKKKKTLSIAKGPNEKKILKARIRTHMHRIVGTYYIIREMK